MQTKSKLQTFNPEDIEKLLHNHFFTLMPGFYEMQSSFLGGIYKRYKSIETANIILCFTRNTHLEILRQRERNLDFNISLENFWDNINIINKPSQKITSVVQSTGIPKETARRKIKNLLAKNFLLVNKNTKEYYWSILPKYKDIYYEITKEEIEILSKFACMCTNHLKLNMEKNMIKNEVESQFSFYWYHFLSCQLLWLKMWQNRIKDIDLILITLQAVIPTLQYVEKNQDIGSIGMDKKYMLAEKIDNTYKLSKVGVSAASISEVTGIPRATCIRKVEKLIKLGVLRKDIKTKKYYVNQSTPIRTKNILTKENTNHTIKIFSEYLAIIINALLRNKK